MATIFLGSSRCSICGEILHENEELVSWKAFLNKDHELWEYSDSGMHKSCFDAWEHKEVFEHLSRYDPLLDFEDPKTKEAIKKEGLSDWMKAVLKYRENHPSSEKK